MKKRALIIIMGVVVVSIASCDILQQFVTFTKCNFKMNSLTNATLANVDIQSKKSFADLNLMDAANVSKTLLGGTLPLSFNLNIEAQNPNATPASMQKLEWKAFIDGNLLATGIMDQKVAIPPSGTQVIPLLVQIDLKKALNKETKNALLNFGFNLVDAGNYPTRVTLDIKPTIYFGSVPIEYPGYFTLKKDFGSN
ncbi:MAG: LEA type 2 family protein [Bacteroidales bacterium]